MGGGIRSTLFGSESFYFVSSDVMESALKDPVERNSFACWTGSNHLLDLLYRIQRLKIP